MTDFRRLTNDVLASPQIATTDIAAAQALGVTTIVNNRPEGESDDQTPGPQIRSAAEQAGMTYHAIPITHAGFSEAQVEAMADVLASAPGPVLAYCRSGTRSTLLWALVQARAGRDLDEIAGIAAAAGYDVGPVRPVMDMLAARARD
ncbi:MAG TPA: TIGR01244 family sulfur transferase [Erythrobacter sp.]|nr:TIGR01244 family sulfur transferase [Erythrobacter sp.]